MKNQPVLPPSMTVTSCYNKQLPFQVLRSFIGDTENAWHFLKYYHPSYQIPRSQMRLFTILLVEVFSGQSFHCSLEWLNNNVWTFWRNASRRWDLSRGLVSSINATVRWHDETPAPWQRGYFFPMSSGTGFIASVTSTSIKLRKSLLRSMPIK